ncbi:MAG: hypothetical protein Q8Q18_03625 [bacterium]|nr:hypothetical protein [bacterium]
MIIPAIIGDNYSEIEEKLDAVRGIADWVQIDLVDGAFAHGLTWPYSDGDLLEMLELPSGISIELHLMVKRPAALIDRILDLPVSRVLFHVESFESDEELRELLTVVGGTEGKEAGIALMMQTPISRAVALLDIAHTVQLMSIHKLGAYGATFTEDIYPRIKELRKCSESVTIEIDGGVSFNNAQLLIDAGANNLVVGSALFKSKNIHEMFNELSQIGV